MSRAELLCKQYKNRTELMKYAEQSLVGQCYGMQIFGCTKYEMKGVRERLEMFDGSVLLIDGQRLGLEGAKEWLFTEEQ